MARLSEVAARIERDVTHKLARGTVVLPLPVYEGKYAVRFGVLEEERMSALYEALTSADKTEANAEAAAGFVADACRQVLARNGKAWENVDHEDGRPVVFDEEFAQALGLELPDGRPMDSSADVVLACWVTDEGKLNESALYGFTLRLITWMGDTRAPVEAEVTEGLPGGLK